MNGEPNPRLIECVEKSSDEMNQKLRVDGCTERCTLPTSNARIANVMVEAHCSILKYFMFTSYLCIRLQQLFLGLRNLFKAGGV
ncbi:hypothetical protein K443DRAFT_307224 [Laccaria amethystina LaAM-08-1]|uniref:Unplaced genomic scaffold K443scaffold_20, whole genome shotgun sequence n=1 Tax=Laccaria amethystina LaAM-08-1 TaxID=1095629 RepID=A0A0C9X1Q3_9AGAR|nr:hypothetical protein K443DRAFT_307224 [Laccaria amethystina LaAM-08-1]